MVILGSILCLHSIFDTKMIVKLIENYAEVHVVILPRCYPDVKDFERVKLLSSSITKHSVFLEYQSATKQRKNILTLLGNVHTLYKHNKSNV